MFEERAKKMFLMQGKWTFQNNSSHKVLDENSYRSFLKIS